jgi:hypothetical protein
VSLWQLYFELFQPWQLLLLQGQQLLLPGEWKGRPRPYHPSWGFGELVNPPDGFFGRRFHLLFYQLKKDAASKSRLHIFRFST